MPTTIDSTRFGRIEVAPDSAIVFPHGLAGLDSRALHARRARAGRRVRVAALAGRPGARAAARRPAPLLRRLRWLARRAERLGRAERERST